MPRPQQFTIRRVITADLEASPAYHIRDCKSPCDRMSPRLVDQYDAYRRLFWAFEGATLSLPCYRPLVDDCQAATPRVRS